MQKVNSIHMINSQTHLELELIQLFASSGPLAHEVIVAIEPVLRWS